MKKLYIVRHGETEFNRKGIVQGSGVDSSLNDLGKRQAEAFYRAYEDIPFTKIYTSALKRTVESVEPFISDGIPFEKLPGLNEISWGYKEGKPYFGDGNIEYEEVIRAWSRGESHVAVPGGESPDQVMERQRTAWEEIMKHQNENPVLICMHGRAMRILLTWLTQTPFSRMDDFEHANLCLYLLNVDGANVHIERFNDQEHLKEVMSL